MSELLSLPEFYSAPRIGSRWFARMGAFVAGMASFFALISLIG